VQMMEEMAIWENILIFYPNDRKDRLHPLELVLYFCDLSNDYKSWLDIRAKYYFVIIICLDKKNNKEGSMLIRVGKITLFMYDVVDLSLI
jgi:hypothetical protein